MFGWWGRAVVRLRWWVVAGALALIVAGATWGAGVFGALTGGGYEDPDSQSNRAARSIAAQFGQRDPDLLVLWSSETATVEDAAYRSAVTSAVGKVRGRAEVERVAAYTDEHAPPGLGSRQIPGKSASSDGPDVLGIQLGFRFQHELRGETECDQADEPQPPFGLVHG